MIDVIHLYDNTPVIPDWEWLLPGYSMVYHPCALVDFGPEVLLTRQFHLIVFDVSGKEESSVAIFQQLDRWIELSGAVHPPIIVIVEKGSALTERSARMAGADFFFIKPVDMSELVLVFAQIVLSMHIS